MLDRIHTIAAAGYVGATERVLRTFVAIAGIDPDSVTASNAEQARAYMLYRGFEIVQGPDNDSTVYRLLWGGRTICAARVWVTMYGGGEAYRAAIRSKFIGPMYKDRSRWKH